jgi:hypothetical protein
MAELHRSESERLNSLWMSIFRRKGRNGNFTRLFDAMESSRQNALLSSVTIRESELPVIGSVQDRDNWLLLTTERSVRTIRGERLEIANENVEDVKSDFKTMQRDGITKAKLHELQLVVAGEVILVELELGQPLIGVWHILINLRNRNGRARERETRGPPGPSPSSAGRP